MDNAGLRPSPSVSSRISSIDVGQLDKINAIPNKANNNVLLEGLSIEDQLYLDTLMDNESTDSDSNFDNSGSPWSPPMAERPMTLNMSSQKRIKMKMKPQYTITMSLEDISYIRPSWGMSKGFKKIDMSKHRSKKMAAKEKVSAIKIDELEKEAETEEAKKKKRPVVNPYHLFLASLLVMVLMLIGLSYVLDVSRHNRRAYQYRIELHPSERAFNVFKQKDGQLVRHHGLRVNYGRGIPSNLKHDECTCEMFAAERREHLRQFQEAASESRDERDNCFACFDWARRTNMQMFVNKSHYNNLMNHQHSGMLEEDLAITCYDIKWQSYDTLETPLVDCFEMGDEQWFGLGDIQTPLWPLNKFDQDEFVPLMTNLSSEFQDHYLPLGFMPLARPTRQHAGPISFGSQVDFSLLTSNGFFIGNLRTDLQPAIKISASRREICLSVVCADKCSQLWTRHDDEAQRFRFQNNLLEYSICSTSSWRLLSLRLIDERTHRLTTRMGDNYGLLMQNTRDGTNSSREINKRASPAQEPLKQAAPPETAPEQQQQQQQPASSTGGRAEPIALIERTIFKTSQEFMSELNGQTVRQLVDKIVKLNLKTSPILMLDTRWQSYVGSFKLNAASFPKAKLLFEILHNKGFKIIMTVKPYIDINIGIAALRQLLDQKRLVTAQYDSDLEAATATTGRDNMISVAPQGFYLSSPGTSTFKRLETQPDLMRQNLATTVVRRKSFFSFKKETVFFKDELEHQLAPTRRKPYLFDCKESYSGQCVLIDIVAGANRAWMLQLIMRSTFLAQEADGILLAGTHPDSHQWNSNYRRAMFELVDELCHGERLNVIPQWTNNFNYVQLAARARTWDGLRSIVDSVLNLGIQGFALIHPGSVWGDIKWGTGDERAPEASATNDPDHQDSSTTPATLDELAPGAGLDAHATEPGSLIGRRAQFVQLDARAELANAELRDQELATRWLQVAVFLPILQFNDLAPIERYQLHEQLESLVRIRKLFVVPEMKKNLPFTPLIDRNFSEFKSKRPANQQQLAALRYTWNNNAPVAGANGRLTNEAIGQQFMIGADLLVAPVLLQGQRLKDIYLPMGIWHDELRKLNIRGGKWLRNYPIELNEVAWFTRAKR